MTLLFVIPLKSSAHSRDWSQSCNLLNATLRSIEAQTSGEFHTFLVCTEPPKLDRPYRNFTCLETEIRIDGTFDPWKGRTDKQRKILFGLLHARTLAPDHAMVVDADDLLHRDLVKFVCRQDTSADALIINKGFRYDIGSPRLRRIKPFHLASGSSMIFPYRAADFRGIQSCLDVDRHFMTREAHPKPAEKVFTDEGLMYRYVPFPAAIYVRGHADSIRDNFARQSKAQKASPGFRVSRLKKRVVNLAGKAIARLQGSPAIDDRIRRDFEGLPEPE